MGRESFQAKIAIVTGASSGIGRATALALAAKGARLSLGSRNEAALNQVASQICGSGGEALVIPTDVSQQDQVEALVQKTLQTFGRVDILIANGGQYIRSKIVDLTVPLLEQSMAVNFYGGVYAVLAVLPHMLAQHSGHIVLVSTMDARKGLTPDVPYVAAKFALSGFGEVLRQELYQTGVYATTIYPGRVDTPMIEDLEVPRISAKIPAEAVADAILKGIDRRQVEIFLPPQTRLLYYLNVFFPGLADRAAHLFRLEGWET
jgi:3-dehydrosphinganine reductase